ncbi:MAG: DUF3486 family protein [Alphaproteobacteria bacterium]|nr:DUF3486 family protein [Alphaproteobacteria bacterium]
MERSSAERLPPALREAVDAATAAGATIERIAALIRSAGHTCSRSAASRSPKGLSAPIRKAREAGGASRAWAEEAGARSGDCAGLIAIESLRTLALSALAEIARREGPVPVDDINRLALALRRIESADRLRQARERAEARAAPGAGQAPVRKGLSDEAVAAIRAFVEGRPRRAPATPAPVGPRYPTLSRLIPLYPALSRLIPVNPT